VARFSSTGGSGSGSALNYVQVVGGQATIASAPSSIIDLDITTTGKPVQISVTGEGSNASAGSWIRVNLFRDGVAIGNEIQIEASATSENVPYAINFIDDVAAGTYNYSVRATDKSSGNWQFGEVAGPVMNAVELTGFKGDDGADGADGIANLVVPFTMKDENGDDLLGFEKGGTGVTRINALQDDLALRSSNDIILYPGDDGPGNVYIGWGDATYTPDATNRVATIADIQEANTGDITFVENTISSNTGDDIIIQNKNDSGVVKARITLDQSNEQVLIEAIRENDDWFNDSQWSTAVWSGTSISITSTPDIINFFDTVPGNVTRISVNNDDTITYGGASYGSGNITIDVGGTPPAGQDPLTITEIRFYYSEASVINIDHDDSEFEIISRGMSMTIDSSGDLDLTARDEDINLNARDDIDFTANWNTDGTAYEWRMTNTGRFELPGAGYISNPDNSSGDGSGNDTLHLVPDSNLINNEYHEDQYLIIDPTAPNHIHIRAGGDIDESNAYLIVGGEKTNVIVSDGDRNVYVNSRSPFIINSYTNLSTENSTTFTVALPADIQVNYTVNVGGTDYIVDSVNSVDEGVIGVTANGAVFDAEGSYTFTYEEPYSNQWTFDSDGTFYGPAMGGVRVTGLLNSVGEDLYVTSTDANINMSATDNVTLTATDGNVFISTPSGGQYLGDSVVAENQIATIGDLDNTVSNGMVRYSPTFTATGLAFTGSGATYPTYNSYYVKSGSMVSFVIEVDLSTVTNFGTDQYKLQLPFTPAFGFNHFAGWCWADPNVSPDIGTGHTIINADTAGVTDVLDLHYLKSAGGANAPIREGLFLQGTPVTLTTISKIYVNGTYIAAE
jgi:hypothetical protein